VALVLLFKVGLRLMRDYDNQIKAGVVSPVLDAKNFMTWTSIRPSGNNTLSPHGETIANWQRRCATLSRCGCNDRGLALDARSAVGDPDEL
jgi:hypothetical protein